MSRLTRYRDDIQAYDYIELRGGISQAVTNKLGKLEDLLQSYNVKDLEELDKLLEMATAYEELSKQLGCPLEVVFKALGRFIYDEDGNSWYIEHYYQEHNVYQLHSVRNFGRIADKKFNTKDYKKTWFLKKDKSE